MRENFKNIGPLARTVIHLKPQQIIARAEYRLRRVYYQSPLYPALEDEIKAPTKLKRTPPELWKGTKGEGRRICDNNFEFVGRTINMGKDVHWYPNEASALWIYNLHYFEWLKDLKALGEEGIDDARRLVEDWLENCCEFNSTSWHPYPLSLRLISWITYGEWLLDGARVEFKELFLGSMIQQAHLLEKCLEWDVGGNHLIKNIKALIYVGLCVPGQQTTYLDALNILLDQIKIQVFPDGGHFERSPHYHVDVLQDLLDIQAMIRRAGHSLPPQISDAVDRMTTALAFYMYPDEHLGLFNDGAIGEKKKLRAILSRCGQPDDIPVHMQDTGYARLERGQTMIMMDAGYVCPNELPAHGHADTLSFEMCVGKERIFVNSGTHAYQHASRNIFRGTAAHNTVEVDRTDSAEVWGAFRVGRRPKTVRATVREEAQTGIGIDAAHDGYRHLGVTHNRRIFMNEEGNDIRGEDYLESKNKLKHTSRAHFHLHPDVTYQIKNNNEAIIETAKGVKLSLKISGGRLHDAESKYAPHFGEMVPNRQLVVQGDWKNNVCTIKWAIRLIK